MLEGREAGCAAVDRTACGHVSGGRPALSPPRMLACIDGGRAPHPPPPPSGDAAALDRRAGCQTPPTLAPPGVTAVWGGGGGALGTVPPPQFPVCQGLVAPSLPSSAPRVAVTVPRRRGSSPLIPETFPTLPRTLRPLRAAGTCHDSPREKAGETAGRRGGGGGGNDGVGEGGEGRRRRRRRRRPWVATPVPAGVGWGCTPSKVAAPARQGEIVW